MRRLSSYLARHGRRYAVGGACLLAATSFTMTVPWLLKRAIDALVAGGGVGAVAHWAGVVAVVAVVQAGLRTASRFLILGVARDVEYELRNDVFAHLQRLPPAFHQRARTGDLMSRLVNDVGAVRLFLGPGMVNFVNAPLYLAYGLGVMLALDVRLTLVSLALYPLVVLWVERRGGALMARTARVQEGLADLSTRAQENLAGMRVVKAYAGEAAAVAEFARTNQAFERQSVALARLRGVFGPLLAAVAALGTLAVLWYGGREVIAGRLSVGDLVAFVAYLQILAVPTAAFGWMVAVLQRGRAAMQRLDEILATAPSITSPPGARAIAHPRGGVALHGVSFGYGAADHALRDVTLRVAAGSLVAVVGPSGAGKTSLVQLLPRLFDVRSGAVLLDGRDVRSLPLAWVRRHVGLAPQDPFLFRGTIRENVALGCREDHGRHVERAVHLAGLERDLARLPHGLETPVGERGVTLSGGQRQRIALARVLAMAPPVCVLDDPLSSVDAETEQRVLAGLRGFFRERTTIMVSHRLASVRDADLIVVVDGGRVVETGDHDEFVRRGGFYARFFFGDDAAAAARAV